MERISAEQRISFSKLAFGLYFLGLFSLMFGWAHHTYPIPNAPWIRHIAYFVSMTELLVLGKIIWDWRSSLSTYARFQHRLAYQFLFAADIWVFLNLILGLIISVPAANLFTHGTHVTVAHAMGTTIGINTMILLASVFYIIEENFGFNLKSRHAAPVRAGFWVANGCLLFFLTSLIAAGVSRGTYTGESFAGMMEAIEPYLLAFAGSGLGVLLGLWMILLPATHLIGLLILPFDYRSSALRRR
jgi:nitric oxide reductase subunit B